jgi:hypothetical protein
VAIRTLHQCYNLYASTDATGVGSSQAHLPTSPPNIYQKLPEQTIRLLLLHPGSSSDSLKADLELFHIPPSSNPIIPSYEALSYTWGDLTFSEDIFCGGVTLPITPNLSQALIHLRNQDITRILWVDAICINQRDNAEKATQILLMPSIYTHAHNVIIWLGPLDGSTKPALALCRKAAACARNEITANELATAEAEVQDFKTRRVDREFWTEEKLQRWGLPSPQAQADHYKALANLCDRGWFSRVWTQQEVVLATSATIHIGNECLDWLDFALAIEFFVGKGLTPFELVKEITLKCLSSRIWAFDGTPTIYDLEMILSSTRGLKTSEPKDKIYGVLGMARKDWHRRAIVIDYATPLEELFAHVTRYLIARSYDVGFPLNVLSDAGYPNSGSDQFPSWVPQCHKPLMTERVIRGREFTAGGNFNYHEAKVGKLPEPYSLRLDGFVVGGIERGKILNSAIISGDTTEINFPKFWSMFITLHTFVDFAVEGYIAGQPLHQAFATILSRGSFCDEAYLRLLFDGIYQFMLWAAKKNGNVDEQESLVRDWYPRLGRIAEDVEEILPGVFMFWEDIKRSAVGRKLFRAEGKYIGLGPASLDAGDQVCVLFGGRTPFVLRPLGDGNFRFIGECYVHGIMCGELLNQGRKKRREFVLL